MLRVIGLVGSISVLLVFGCETGSGLEPQPYEAQTLGTCNTSSQCGKNETCTNGSCQPATPSVVNHVSNFPGQNNTDNQSDNDGTRPTGSP
jgi:hypothetical protein